MKKDAFWIMGFLLVSLLLMGGAVIYGQPMGRTSLPAVQHAASKRIMPCSVQEREAPYGNAVSEETDTADAGGAEEEALLEMDERDASSLLVGTVMALTALSVVVAVLWIAPYLRSREE